MRGPGGAGRPAPGARHETGPGLRGRGASGAHRRLLDFYDFWSEAQH